MTRRYLSNFNLEFDLKDSYDAIIIGSGISGLMCALNISQEKRILIVTKSKLKDNNSSLAQGGIAASIGKKNKESHIQDTLKAGSYINDKNVVKGMINYSDKVIENLMEFGVDFDKDPSGQILFTKEGGHSERRILHCKDQTGDKIIDALIKETLARKNIRVLESKFVIDLLTIEKRACGVILYNNGKKNSIFYSQNIILASGGIGKIFKHTTNIKETTADGIAMAIRAGAKVNDMEFVQFHPTAFNINLDDSFLISEALRGEGAKLINSNGEYFMETMHPLKELAPRDVVSQCIFRELEDKRDVFLDISHMPPSYTKNRFPNIYRHCLTFGIDITKDLIPIRPVQHYFMGGVRVDINGKTSIEGLYAIGECSNTGAHGANRLASNSLLESAVYALIVSREINRENLLRYDDRLNRLEIEKFKYECDIDIKNMHTSMKQEDFKKYKSEIQELMSKYVFIEKTRLGLNEALDKLSRIEKDMKKYKFRTIDYFECINMLTVAKEIVISSIGREISIGSHIINDRSR